MLTDVLIARLIIQTNAIRYDFVTHFYSIDGKNENDIRDEVNEMLSTVVDITSRKALSFECIVLERHKVAVFFACCW